MANGKQKKKEEDEQRGQWQPPAQQPPRGTVQVGQPQQEFRAKLREAEQAYAEWKRLVGNGTLPEDIREAMKIMRAADKFENAIALLRETPGGTFYTTKEGKRNWDMTPGAQALEKRRKKITSNYSEMLALEIEWGVPHSEGAIAREAFLLGKIMELPEEQQLALQAEVFFTKENLERLKENPRDQMSREMMFIVYQRTIEAIRDGIITRADLVLGTGETSNAMHTFYDEFGKQMYEDKKAREEFARKLEAGETTEQAYLAIFQTIFPFAYATSGDIAKKGGLKNAEFWDYVKFIGANMLEAVMWAPVIKVGMAAGRVGWAAIQAVRQEGLREALKRLVPAAKKGGEAVVEKAAELGWKGVTWRAAIYGTLYKINLDEMIDVMSSSESSKLEKAQAALNFARAIALAEGIMYYGGKLTTAIAGKQLALQCIRKIVQAKLLKSMGKTFEKMSRSARLEFRELVEKVAGQLASGKWADAAKALTEFGKKHGIKPLERMSEKLARGLLNTKIARLLGFAAGITAFTIAPWQALSTSVAVNEYAQFRRKPNEAAERMQTRAKELQESESTIGTIVGTAMEASTEMLAGIGIGPDFAEAINEREYVELRRRIPQMTAEEIKQAFEEYTQASEGVRKELSFGTYLAAKAIVPELNGEDIKQVRDAFETVPEEEKGSMAAAAFKDIAHTPFERFVLTANALARADENAERRSIAEEYAALERTQKKFAAQMTLAEYMELRGKIEREELLELAREYGKLDGKTREQMKLSAYVLAKSLNPELTNEELQQAYAEFAKAKDRPEIEAAKIGDRLMTEFETLMIETMATALEQEQKLLEQAEAELGEETTEIEDI